MATAEIPKVRPRIPEDEDKSSARSAILLMIAVIVVAAFAVEFGLQTLIWMETKSWASSNPWILDVPVPLTPSSAPLAPLPESVSSSGKGHAKPAPPAQIKAYNYEFIAPWPGNSTIKQTPNYSVVRFDTGQTIVFFDPETQLNTIREMKTQNAADYLRLENVFGDQTPDTDYALYKAVFGASPKQISPFMNRADAVRANGALLYKLGFGYDAQPGMASFDFGKNRGFEFGDVANGGPVALRVFNDRDDQFRLIFMTAAGSSAKLTQDDINRAAQSLQAVPLLER